jgi:hypothetical protein
VDLVHKPITVNWKLLARNYFFPPVVLDPPVFVPLPPPDLCPPLVVPLPFPLPADFPPDFAILIKFKIVSESKLLLG